MGTQGFESWAFIKKQESQCLMNRVSRYVMHIAEWDSVGPVCKSTILQDGGGSYGLGMLLWHYLWHWIHVDICINSTPYKSIITDQVHYFMLMAYHNRYGHFQQDNASCHRVRIVHEWFYKNEGALTLLRRLPQSSDVFQLSICGTNERAIQQLDPKQSSTIIHEACSQIPHKTPTNHSCSTKEKVAQ